MKQLNANDVSDLLSGDSSAVLVDVREDHELAYGKIERALHIPMQQIPNELHQLGEGVDQTIIVVCHAGVRSMHVAQYLEGLGYSNIVNLVGGMNSWATDVDTTMTVY
jgi:rhodanese-related sulfurtransferase